MTQKILIKFDNYLSAQETIQQIEKISRLPFDFYFAINPLLLRHLPPMLKDRCKFGASHVVSLHGSTFEEELAVEYIQKRKAHFALVDDPALVPLCQAVSIEPFLRRKKAEPLLPQVTTILEEDPFPAYPNDAFLASLKEHTLKPKNAPLFIRLPAHSLTEQEALLALQCDGFMFEEGSLFPDAIFESLSLLSKPA